jgi:hypothetical protein
VTEEKKSFWTGMSGMVAGVTALITAIGALLAVLIQVGVIGGGGGSSSVAASKGHRRGAPTTSATGWASDANAICARANDAINALPDPKTLDAASGLVMLQQSLRLNRQMFRDLTALPTPPDKQAEIGEFLRLGARMNEAADELVGDFRVGNLTAAQTSANNLSRLGQTFDDAAIGLGATTCAEGAAFTGALPSG